MMPLLVKSLTKKLLQKKSTPKRPFPLIVLKLMKLSLLSLPLLVSGKIYGAATGNKVTTDFSKDKAQELVKSLDERERNSGDYKATAFMKEVEKNKEPKLIKATV